MDKQKTIEQMATIINQTDCSSATFDYLTSALTARKSFKGIDTQMFIDSQKAKALVDRGYGNIPQALTEFADFLKDYARQVQENGYDGIGENDIDEKLKEFLNNEVS